MTGEGPQVDPGLRCMLDDADQNDRVEAVVMLASINADEAPEEVQARVSGLLDEVADESGQGKYEVNVFGYLGSFAIAAPPAFLELLLRRPEVGAARSNRDT